MVDLGEKSSLGSCPSHLGISHCTQEKTARWDREEYKNIRSSEKARVGTMIGGTVRWGATATIEFTFIEVL
jgi:hypothetical protein